MYLTNTLRRILVCIIPLAAMPAVLAAQASQLVSPPRAVTLVERAALPQGHRAMVFRRASGPATGDFIALTPNATASDLSAAIALLDGLYARYGERPERDIAVAISDAAGGIGTDAPRAKRHATFVQQLRAARPSSVEGFGRVKALHIHVRPRRARVEPARAP